MTFTTPFSPRSVKTAVIAAFVALPLLGACSSTATQNSSGADMSADQPSVASTEGLMIIDVRTPGEFSEQRLDGAVNINLQADDFVEQISKLDRNGTYAIYCRSGNRSSQAVAAMKTLGFTNVSDHGSVAEASASLGVSVVS